MRSTIGTAPGLPRTPFNSPALVRLLAQWDVQAAPHQPTSPAPREPSGSLAERLGLWLDWTDAIALSAALNQPTRSDTPAAAAGAGASAGAAATVQAMALGLDKLQASQARLITTNPVYLQGADSDGMVDVAPYRRACQARQRAMGAAIAPLRERLRGALAATAPALAQLARLDAILETALAERERHVLGGVVGHIEQQFLRLRQAATTGWQARFHQHMQQALLAELDLRLQPALGLLAALRQAHGQPQDPTA